MKLINAKPVFAEFCRLADLIRNAGPVCESDPGMTAAILCSKIALRTGSDFGTIWAAAAELAFPTCQDKVQQPYPGSQHRR